MMLSLLIAFGLLQTQSPVRTPFARGEGLSIGDVRLSAKEVPRLGVEEIEVDAHGTFDNPFDPADVALDARVIPPKGSAYDVPGFFYRPYSRELKNGKEVLSPAGNPEWRVRISPTVEGEHRVLVTFRDRSGVARAKEVRFTAIKAVAPGMVRVSDRDRRYFEFENGEPFYPVGSNVCWGNDAGTFSYDRWFPAYGKQNANYARLWLSPSWTTFALEVPGKPEEGKGLGQIDLANAWRLDYVTDLAAHNGIQLQYCLESYNILRDRDAYPWWEKTPHNVDNGGPLRVWSDFWTDPEMNRLFLAKLRYLVARYSANSNLFAWEFWNEVDLTRDFDIDAVRDWHRRMGDALHRMDPYHHLVTTSTANTMGYRDLELIPELDFYQTHHYGSPDLAATVVQQQSRKTWGRPHLIAEIGADAGGPRVEDDPAGIQIHDPIWASIASGVSGTASPWWWDNLTDPKDLYPLFGAAARFVHGVDWPKEDFRIGDTSFAYQHTPATPVRRNLVLGDGAVSFEKSANNRPMTLRVSESGVSGGRPAGIQHGVRNHPDLHNPILFKMTLKRPTRFEVVVGDVSGYGGAKLHIELDGDRVLSRDFKDPDDSGKTDTLTQYKGRYGFTVPAGFHTVSVENTGNDWFMATFRFLELVPSYSPPIEGWCVTGNRTVLAWFRPVGRTWNRLAVLKEKPQPVPPTVVGFAGLASGKWRAEYWDTWRGAQTGSRKVTVPRNGKVRVPLPAFASDLALKMVKEG